MTSLPRSEEVDQMSTRQLHELCSDLIRRSLSSTDAAIHTTRQALLEGQRLHSPCAMRKAIESYRAAVTGATTIIRDTYQGRPLTLPEIRARARAPRAVPALAA